MYTAKNEDDAATTGTGLLIGVACILGVCVIYMHWEKQTVTIRNEL